MMVCWRWDGVAIVVMTLRSSWRHLHGTLRCKQLSSVIVTANPRCEMPMLVVQPNYIVVDISIRIVDVGSISHDARKRSLESHR